MKLLKSLALVTLTMTPLFMPAQQQTFESAFDNVVHEDGVVGAAYLLLDKGQTTALHTIGMADESVHQAVNANTIFHWASITKTFTAVAIMQLRDRGKLSLDDPIVKYIPELTRVHSKDDGIAKVTLRHLLSHTAGFQSPTWPYTEGRPWEPFEPTEWSQLVAMMPYQELSFAPGTKYQYSNPGFIYLARVIEALSGDPYQVYVQKNILTPLGMTHSYFNGTPYHLQKDRARSYVINIDNDGRKATVAYPRDFNTGITTANGGLNAPLPDMAKWISFLSGNGPWSNSDVVLARKSLEEMWRPVIAHEEGVPPSTPESMGLSFFLYPRKSGESTVTFVGHTGHQAGFALFFLINPNNGRALIGAMNTVHGDGTTPAAERFSTESADRFRHLMEEGMVLLR